MRKTQVNTSLVALCQNNISRLQIEVFIWSAVFLFIEQNIWKWNVSNLVKIARKRGYLGT